MSIDTTAATAPAPADARTIAVTALPAKFVAAWAAQDADAFAEVFTETGTMVLPGVFCKGREEIRAFMAEAFAGRYRGTQVTGMPISLEFFGDTAVLVTRGGVMAAGQNKVSPARAVRASWIAVVDYDCSWRLGAYHNCPLED